MLDHLIEPDCEYENDEVLETEEFEAWLDRCDQEAEERAIMEMELREELDELEYMEAN